MSIMRQGIYCAFRESSVLFHKRLTVPDIYVKVLTVIYSKNVLKFIPLSIDILILVSGKASELPLRELQSNGSHIQTIKPP